MATANGKRKKRIYALGGYAAYFESYSNFKIVHHTCGW